MALIIDLTRLSAAYGPRLLAEAGHRIVRIDSNAGDDVRRAGPPLKEEVNLEHGAVHQFINAGKESLSLNVDTPEGAQVLAALVAAAGAVIVTKPFRFDAEWFFAANPAIAVVEVDDPGNEICAYARSGLMSLTGHPEAPPMLIGGHAAYGIIGLYTAIAASSAMTCAQIAGEGQHVDVSAAQCLESVGEQALLTYHTTGETPERRGFRGAITAVSGAFPCADGYWMISVPHEPVGWANLMEWVNDPVLKADPQLAHESHRQTKRDFILDRLSEWSKQHKKEDLVVEAQRMHVPASPVATVLDLAQDPQLIARGFLKEIDHPEFGRMLFPMGATAHTFGVTLSPAPRLGQHNAAILAELGWQRDEAQALLLTGAA
jgi:crotonobetainyl-CoA:carnitine CoA-transferase CaiB-like acyl-CoA transferase